MVLIEGAFIGFLGGVIGGMISLGIIFYMYGAIPGSELWLPLNYLLKSYYRRNHRSLDAFKDGDENGTD
jgi:ABC-type antimicrobial peptide transport system permease subunit